jgi:hypothetical protein
VDGGPTVVVGGQRRWAKAAGPQWRRRWARAGRADNGSPGRPGDGGGSARRCAEVSQRSDSWRWLSDRQRGPGAVLS